MSRRFAAIFLAAAAALCASLLSGAEAGAAVVTTSTPAGATGGQVPSSAALSPGQIDSVSCSSAGDCVAGGYYNDNSADQHAFLMTERNGVWGMPQGVRGLARLGGSSSAIASVSCSSPGNCSAVGDNSSGDSAFVVDERHGIWGSAERVHGLAALTGSEGAGLLSLSCTSAGNCAAYGTYDQVTTLEQGLIYELAFVVSEKHGRWGTARAVPGLAALNKTVGGMAAILSLSCGSAGNCSAGGFYGSFKGSGLAFIVTEKHGTWGRAEQVPGLSRLGKGGDGGADVNSVSCGSAGDCSAGGGYDNASGSGEGFVINEKDGTWRRAEQVPGLARLNTGGGAGVDSLSCASAGNCSAVGSYSVGSLIYGFVVTEKHGTWGRAEPVPGLARLNTGGDAYFSSLSCASAGNCSAVGSYYNGHGTQAFVVSQKHGTWRRAEPVPGLASLNTGGYAYVSSLSCASAGNCSAGGYYTVGYTTYGFVVTEKHGTWGAARVVE